MAAGLPYRDFVTVGLLVDRLNLKNETKLKTLGNIVPDCWIYVQDADVKLGRIQIFNNWSPYHGEGPGAHGVDRAGVLLQRGRRLLVGFGARRPCHSGGQRADPHGRDRQDETHVLDSPPGAAYKKAYPAYFDTYDDIGRGRSNI